MTVAGLAAGRNFHIQNNLREPVWVGILGNDGRGQPNNGGFALYPGQRVSKRLKSCGCGTWSARERNYTEATEENKTPLYIAKFYNINHLFPKFFVIYSNTSKVKNSF
jgi:hypothetical protein